MQHEKIIKRPNGDSVKIWTRLIIRDWDGAPKYMVSVFVKPIKKKTWESIRNADNYTWRRLDTKGHEEFDMNKFLEHVSAEEILEVKRELWKLLEPK